MSPIRSWRRPLLALTVGALSIAAPGFAADDATIAATIRGNLAKRLPNLPAIDEVNRSPVPGLWELRIGSHVIYSDSQGSFVIEGEIVDTSTNVNLTRQRIDDLTAFDFAKLPLKDAVVWKQRQRRPQARGVRRSELRLLQEARARSQHRSRHHRLHVPGADSRWRLARRSRATSGARRIAARRGATG